jgi:hypothetical protein
VEDWHVRATFRDVLWGATCRRALVQGYWFEGALRDPANVVFVELGPRSWVRFFFDGGVFFWQEVPEAVAVVSEETADAYALTELEGSRGRRVSDVSFGPLEARIAFDGGGELVLTSEGDISRVELRAAR